MDIFTFKHRLSRQHFYRNQYRLYTESRRFHKQCQK